MFDFPLIQESIFFLTRQPLVLQLSFILLAYGVAPLFGIPITLITYGVAFIFGFKLGGLLALIGYCLSLVILLEGAAFFKETNYIKKFLKKIEKFFPTLSQQLSIPLIIGLASIFPYLPLVIMMGLTQKEKLTTYGALLIGSLPAFVIALQAGVVGNSLMLSSSKTRLTFSLAILFIALIIHVWILKKTKKKLSNL